MATRRPRMNDVLTSAPIRAWLQVQVARHLTNALIRLCLGQARRPCVGRALLRVRRQFWRRVPLWHNYPMKFQGKIQFSIIMKFHMKVLIKTQIS